MHILETNQPRNKLLIFVIVLSLTLIFTFIILFVLTCSLHSCNYIVFITLYLYIYCLLDCQFFLI